MRYLLDLPNVTWTGQRKEKNMAHLLYRMDHSNSSVKSLLSGSPGVPYFVADGLINHSVFNELYKVKIADSRVTLGGFVDCPGGECWSINKEVAGVKQNRTRLDIYKRVAEMVSLSTILGLSQQDGLSKEDGIEEKA